ncbi:unnamed protein product [Cyclocybe aegerita]|uniref:Uncharacterized protein n=1 Tax=Cyclocybe aegerita TaxID=1973307 RepID=A0A8S0WX98_CYCAE|nr:unnamed protein product [Cyclocybe aegerita]
MDPDKPDLFLGLINELELLAGKNTLKNFMFNEVITHKAFPHLERFDLEFWVYCQERYDGPFAAYRSRLEDDWAERNRIQCPGVSVIPGLKFDCDVVIRGFAQSQLEPVVAQMHCAETFSQQNLNIRPMNAIY